MRNYQIATKYDMMDYSAACRTAQQDNQPKRRTWKREEVFHIAKQTIKGVK